MYHKTYWTAEKIEQRIALIEPLVYRRRHPIDPFHYTTLPDPMTPPPLGKEVDDGDWQVIEPYTHWGKRYTDFLMRSQFTVPAGWDTEAPVALFLPLGEAGDFSHPEALAYIDGEAYGTCDRHHQEVQIPDRWRDGQPHRLELHGWTGLIGYGASSAIDYRNVHADPGLFMHPCAVVQIDQPTRDFVAMARVALGVANAQDENAPAKGHLLNALNAAFKDLDIREPFGDDFYASVPRAHATLKAGVEKAGPPMDVDVVASGHAHIDVAWLWTLGETRRKSGRTFHTVLRLMEQFPDYHFTQSQPQLYDYVKQDYPELFEAIKQRIAEGRWETIGGMWVEADCNLSGPESLARQFLLGRTFFREHFGPGVDSPVLWLPDVFGYAWALPQLIKEAGLEYFFTIKIGWSQYNRLPYDSFWWQGLDGTQVLTHFSTTKEPNSVFASTYNAMASPGQNVGTWTNFQQKELQQELLMAFGYGDGGGGPTREMLENIREMANFPGAPRMRQGPVGEFFRNLEQTSGQDLPTWNGELYLELHRGTYTTQSRNKRANRKSEFLLHDAEFTAVLASLLDGDYAYPAEQLNNAWELVCLNQFHDIIPGSSIGPVYTESQQQYALVRQMGEEVRDAALQVVARAAGADVAVVNPTGFAFGQGPLHPRLAFWADQPAVGQRLETPDGTPVATQVYNGGTWIDPGALAPFSVTPLRAVSGDPVTPVSNLVVSPELLENDSIRVELNDEGDITRIYDKEHGREVLPEGAVANQFQALEDRPLNWDAWDVDIFLDDKQWTPEPATSVRVIESGPLRATLEIRRRILNSNYVQHVSLNHNSPQLDFDTTIDWRERHIMLKVAFPVEILAPTATYEIQWGNVQRPTHRNTSWDWARFETAAQKWVDLNEGNYGVSLLNDCKYGHDIVDNVMRISLLRSPTLPDPEADQGEHRFSYSLLPHGGNWGETTIAAAYGLNDPLLVVAASPAEYQPPWVNQPWLAVDRSNVVVETVKRAEDGNGIIVRFYESGRQRGPMTLTTAFPLAAAERTNLMEEKRHSLEVHNQSVSLAVRPYEIVTLRLVPA